VYCDLGDEGAVERKWIGIRLQGVVLDVDTMVLLMEVELVGLLWSSSGDMSAFCNSSLFTSPIYTKDRRLFSSSHVHFVVNARTYIQRVSRMLKRQYMPVVNAQREQE